MDVWIVFRTRCIDYGYQRWQLHSNRGVLTSVLRSGRVCKAGEVDYMTGCCRPDETEPGNGQGGSQPLFSCDNCNISANCCSVYEFCVVRLKLNLPTCGKLTLVLCSWSSRAACRLTTTTSAKNTGEGRATRYSWPSRRAPLSSTAVRGAGLLPRRWSARTSTGAK